MSDEELEDLLRTTFERDAQRVPLTQPEWDGIMRLRTHSAAPLRRRNRVRIATIALLVPIGIATGVALASNDRSTEPDRVVTASSPATESTVPAMSIPGPAQSTTTTIVGATTETTVLPPVTLPAATVPNGTPMTVAGTPTTYYRLAEDIDLAWIDDGNVPQLCWRTPIDERCVPEPIDALGQTKILIIPSSAQHTVVLAFDTTGDPATRALPLRITFINGRTQSTAAGWQGDPIDVGVVRLSVGADEILSVEWKP